MDRLASTWSNMCKYDVIHKTDSMQKLSQRRHRTTKPRPCATNSRIDTQTHRETDTLITILHHPYPGKGDVRSQLHVCAAVHVPLSSTSTCCPSSCSEFNTTQRSLYKWPLRLRPDCLSRPTMDILMSVFFSIVGLFKAWQLTSVEDLVLMLLSSYKKMLLWLTLVRRTTSCWSNGSDSPHRH